MIKTWAELRNRIKDVYPNITESCKNCKYPDCRGYIYLLDNEIDEIVENDIPVLCINHNVFLVNNFRKNDGLFDLTEYSPRCKLRCNNGMCSIQNIKPFVCLFYPIIIEKYCDGKHYWSLHKQCQYYVDLKERGIKEKIIMEFLSLLDEISCEMYDEIVDAYFKYDRIMVTEYTDYDIEILKEVRKMEGRVIENV